MVDKADGDRILETTQTTGTGTYNLDGQKTGFQTFSDVIVSGKQVEYIVTDYINFEIGDGTLSHGSPDTITRDNIIASSNNGNPVNWAAGIKDIGLTLPAERNISADSDRHVPIQGTVTVSPVVDEPGMIFQAVASQTELVTKWEDSNNVTKLAVLESVNGFVGEDGESVGDPGGDLVIAGGRGKGSGKGGRVLLKTAPTINDPAVVDEGGTDHNFIGTWYFYFGFPPPGYNGGSAHVAGTPGDGSKQSNWNFFNLVSGREYQLAVTWPIETETGDTHTTQANYNIYNSGVFVETISVDQTTTPADFTFDGVGWKILGNYTPTGTSLRINLTSNAGDTNSVVADAGLAQSNIELPPNPLTTIVEVLGNGMLGLNMSGADVTATLDIKTVDVKSPTFRLRRASGQADNIFEITESSGSIVDAAFDENGDLILNAHANISRPSPGKQGRIIYNTDDVNINIDTGSNWILPDGSIT